MSTAAREHPGFFISLDGPDGAGKTTQMGRLADTLRASGRRVVSCRDPGGTPLGDRLRSLLLDRHELAIGMRAEMLLYMASRAQLVEGVIAPALAAGEIVLCDRYLLANVVYQGLAGGLPVDQLWDVGHVATGGLLPDLTLLLDIAPETARSRAGPPRDRIEDRPESYRRAVRDGFLQAAASYPAPIVTIDASGDSDTVFQHLHREVARALGTCSRT